MRHGKKSGSVGICRHKTKIASRLNHRTGNYRFSKVLKTSQLANLLGHMILDVHPVLPMPSSSENILTTENGQTWLAAPIDSEGGHCYYCAYICKLIEITMECDKSQGEGLTLSCHIVFQNACLCHRVPTWAWCGLSPSPETLLSPKYEQEGVNCG